MAPAFWSCVDKVVTSLLTMANLPERHGVRPRSLNVTMISALIPEVITGNANSAQIAIQGNYRDIATHDMTEIYPRGVAHQRLSASNFAQSAFLGDKGMRNLATAPTVLLEIEEDPDAVIFASRGRAEPPPIAR